jgi:RAB protein geranylgeranyltransferase component A
MSGWVQACVFNSRNSMQSVSSSFQLEFESMEFLNLGICSVLNFWEFKFEVFVEVDAIVVSI